MSHDHPSSDNFDLPSDLWDARGSRLASLETRMEMLDGQTTDKRGRVGRIENVIDKMVLLSITTLLSVLGTLIAVLLHWKTGP